MLKTVLNGKKEFFNNYRKKVMGSITNLKVTIVMISHSDASLKYFNQVIDLNDFK